MERRVRARKPRAVGVHSCGVNFAEACEAERGDDRVEAVGAGALRFARACHGDVDQIGGGEDWAKGLGNTQYP